MIALAKVDTVAVSEHFRRMQLKFSQLVGLQTDKTADRGLQAGPPTDKYCHCILAGILY